MFKVISMSDSNYFPSGELFLKTRNKVDADFVLYGPDLNSKQISIMAKNNIEYIKINNSLFQIKMQSLKFDFILEQIIKNHKLEYDGFTFCDFDTFFINDWSNIFKHDFDFGITIRSDMVSKRVLRAYSNGGVMFAKKSCLEFLEFTNKTILNGRDDLILPEYNTIWKTLEYGRPKEKTYYRENHRWWVDQVFISSIALKYFENNGYNKIGFNPITFNFNNAKIGLFSCNYYNVLDSNPKITTEKNIFIRHLKSKGRIKLVGKDVTKEKI